MQASIDAEAKGRAEAIRQKKAVEQTLAQAEITIDQMNRNNVEFQKANKRLQQTVSEYQVQIEEEQRQRNEARELLTVSERTCNSLMAELSAANSNLASQKRKLETDLAALRADLDEAFVELRNSEERVKKASGDAARLTEELRAEQVMTGINMYF